MKQHGSKYFACRHPRPWGLGSKGQNLTFSEHGHDAYQTKRNRECSNMQAHPYSFLSHTIDLWVGSKVNFFSESSHVAYPIGKEWSIEHHASTYSVLTHTLNLRVGLKG